MPGALDSFLEYQEQRLLRGELERSTINLRRQQLELFERERGPLEETTTEAIQDWVDNRRGRNGKQNSSKSRAGYLTTLNVFFKWCVENNYVQDNPITPIARPRIEAKVESFPLTDEDVERAIELSTGVMRCWTVVAAYAGLIPQELAYLTRSDIDTTTAPASLRISHGKGSTSRIVPLDSRALDELMATPMMKSGTLPTSGRLFPTVTPRSVSQRINRFLHGKVKVQSTARDLSEWYGWQKLMDSDAFRRNQDLMQYAGRTRSELQISPSHEVSVQADDTDDESFSGDFHKFIPRISEVAEVGLAIPPDLARRLRRETQGLLVPDDLLDECAAALISGNVVLQGPPGTGKSALSHALARAFNADPLPVTAHEDWSTFEIIGRQELRIENNRETTVPVNGHFTEAVVQCAGTIYRNLNGTTEKQATWLLIDELNRAHPDKAFGELFSVIGAEDRVETTLGYQSAENAKFVVPRRFRIIATINSIDKQFVNALSQGLRRRFTFITVDIPQRRGVGELWGAETSVATREFNVALLAATTRVANAFNQDEATLSAYLNEASVLALVGDVFDLVERVRYAVEEDDAPFIPIGTAPLIDAIELFLVRSVQQGFDLTLAGRALDWATSVKVIPLFDTGSVHRHKLTALAQSLSSPLNDLTRRSMLEIGSDGQFYAG